MKIDTSSLNKKQLEAVNAVDGPLLILAGAGSGKTRCLAYRVANMISLGTHPQYILCITFTNKAAGEMKERVAKLLSGTHGQFHSVYMPMVGTFHSVCLKILRHDIEVLGYGTRFSIYDDGDQTATMKQALIDLAIDPKKITPASACARVSELKNDLIDEKVFSEQAKGFREESIAAAYGAYQAHLHANNAVDFDDMIMLCVRLFREHPLILEKYQDLFRYILVDEYQDTNHAQYVWTNLLAQKHRNIAVVGDDAQSIYGWRKADIRNILDFEKDYPEAKVVTLEQNYRSTQTILTAANHVIANNVEQKKKNLWTDNADGRKIIIKEAAHEREEGNYITETIRNNMKQGDELQCFAVLYRTHAQSRAIEEALLRRNIPYRIIGGVKFYERREVRDVLAYLRLARNPDDTVSFSRIYNTPGRGIGFASYAKIKEHRVKISALVNLPDSVGKLSGRQIDSFRTLGKLLEDFRTRAFTMSLTPFIKYILKKINYEQFLNDKTDEGMERWENVKEILTVAKKFDAEAAPEGIDRFLEEVALIQETDKLDEKGHVVTLMTLHSAKGLEFKTVFMAGMEEGVFPHARSIFSSAELEEERRLCYVGITRAQHQLHLTFCRSRTLYGSTQINPPSRFIFEIPEQLVEFHPTSYDTDKEYVIRYS